MNTIPGGAYRNASGDGWHDANGQPLAAAQIAAAEALHAVHQAELDKREHLRAERDPDTLKALAAVLRPPAAAPVVRPERVKAS